MLSRKIFMAEIVVLAALMCSCAKQNESAAPVTIQLQLGNYSTAQNKMIELFIPKANASVSSLKMCFKRLRFKLAETADDSSSSNSSDDSFNQKSGSDDSLPSHSQNAATEDNIDFNIGEVTVSSNTTQLGSISVPAGVYRRIEFDLDNSCLSGKSVSLVNNFGSYSTVDHVTIKFEGRFEANIDGTLTLGVQQIVNQLNSFNGSTSMKTILEGISGVLSN